ncbi:3-deoxy-D-manno-octulosonic acid transferase [uncultured Fusobacterium sp.]|uniref:3-deoxy-D-manno-octulosonic acid transferase n=1 Tax=uncultured Fusobacterium sp. TaxID=159267 RepID=UPI000BBB2A27|nr:glycosyltransferase N-terminal domain-containing protein [uncultured Fusobacterium sp.]BBA52523.1 3-deoxy-D-manno-octulosonic acid transferase [Fusobacterium varium]
MLYDILRIFITPFIYMYMLLNKEKKEFFYKRINQNLDILKKEEYIWVHCSSVGEVNLSEALVKKILSERKERVLLTVMTDTGMRTAKDKYKDNSRVDILYFPLDNRKIIRSILEKIEMKILILIETEIWPNLIHESHKKGKVIIVNGRISDRSYVRYKKLNFYLKNLFKDVDGFYMQSKLDSEKIVKIGADKSRVEILGNLKFDIELERFDEKTKDDLKKSLGVYERKIFTAGSTRTGEYEIIFKVFKKLTNTLLILVPRHIERVPEIEVLIKKEGMTYKKYSKIDSDNFEKTDIILVDKIGILRKLYSIADIAFVGGTLVDIGGHSLLEPLFYGKTPIFGPYLQNVKDISKEILKKNIGYKVEDADEFLEAVNKIEKNSDIYKKNIEIFFEENNKTAEKILVRIDKLLKMED